MASRGVVRKNLRLTQEKMDRAKKILGTRTETETVEQALDLVAYRKEVVGGIERIAGTGAIRDIFMPLDGQKWSFTSWTPISTSKPHATD